MRFADIRRTFFTIHKWVGLVLGIVLALLGLSGSLLVFSDEITAMALPLPKATVAGTPLALDQIVAAARASAMPERGATVNLTLPKQDGDPVTVRFLKAPPPGARNVGPPRLAGTDVFVDPVSGHVLASRDAAQVPLIAFAHQLHGNLLMTGRIGRQTVGWLGLAMLALGVSGLILWWPKAQPWNAFSVGRGARGFRLYRELHGMAGIWAFLVFILVSFSGVAIAFPESARSVFSGGASAPPALDMRNGPKIESVVGASRIGFDEAAAVARAAVPGFTVASLSVPARATQAIRVTLVQSDRKEAPTAAVFVDPWRAKAVALRDPLRMGGLDNFIAWQRPLHEGQGLGLVWRVLVFIAGFLPALFVTTGILMWLKKRRSRLAGTEAIAEGARA